MRKLLLSPKWWALHLFVLAGTLVMLRLGLWQWHRAQSPSGGIQNYAYAFQWPLFAVFAVGLWWKTLRIEAAGQADESDKSERPLTRASRPAPLPEPEIEHRPGVRVGITTQQPAVGDDDDEVRLYNAYLAQLNSRVPVRARQSAG